MKYDAVVIGFGKGGKTLAARLGREGRSVALIEKDRNMYGGTCINVGCIPSKSLIHSAAAADPEAPEERKTETYREAVEEKRRLTAGLREKNYQKLAGLEHVTVYNGTARFTGPLQVEADTREGVLSFSAEQIFINTGSAPRIPDIEGIRETEGVYTSAGLMELDRFPGRLVIIGGGYIGLEFASMYSAFGSQVTVLQDGETFLPREDEDMADQIRLLLEEQGVEFLPGVRVRKVEEGPAVVFAYQGGIRRLEADAVLLAVGRVPNTAGLNCPAAGVELDTKGAVKVDEYLRTTAPGIWAMGDVTGGRQHTYVSLDDFRIVWSQLSGRTDYNIKERKDVPYSVFLKTPYSRVGMNEREAAAAGRRVKIFRLPVAAVPKAQVLKEPYGMLKAVTDADTGEILGAMLLCQESYEMINLVKLAMDMGADYTVLRDGIYTHPTMTEALNDLFAE